MAFIQNGYGLSVKSTEITLLHAPAQFKYHWPAQALTVSNMRLTHIVQPTSPKPRPTGNYSHPADRLHPGPRR